MAHSRFPDYFENALPNKVKQAKHRSEMDSLEGKLKKDMLSNNCMKEQIEMFEKDAKKKKFL